MALPDLPNADPEQAREPEERIEPIPYQFEFNREDLQNGITISTTFPILQQGLLQSVYMVLLASILLFLSYESA